MAVGLSLSIVSYEHNYYRHKLIGFFFEVVRIHATGNFPIVVLSNSATSITTLRPVELESR
jgi:hypothetical protein